MAFPIWTNESEHTVPQVNANLKADTTDELLKRKKSIHLSAFQYRLDEIMNELQVRCLHSRLQAELYMFSRPKSDPDGF
jgi:hypothetical protein